METSKQFQKLTSILEGISDHTDQIDQVADTAENVSESILSVEKSVSALDKSLTALSNDVKQETTGLRANIAANTESVLDAISASKKNNHTSVQTAADKVEQKLSEAVDELSRRMEQDHTVQQEQREEIWIRFGALAEQFSTERKKLYHILYLSLAMNSATLIGLVATLLMLLLGA
jgi:phosphoglycerate-specific signal transduction histidine kinase